MKHERASPLKKAQAPSPVRPSPRRSASASSSQHAPSPRRLKESLLRRQPHHPAADRAPMDVDGEAEDIEEDDNEENVKEEEEIED